MNVELYLTPIRFTKANLESKTVVVVDVLRFSTSVCAALMAGAKGIIPTDEPGEAGDMWAKLGSDNAVLAGEMGGVKIENFQLGNSPAEFTADVVANKFVIMTTTNGSPVYSKAQKANLVVTGGLVNISRVAEKVATGDNDLIIVCGGREGGFSIEDTICGGMLIHLLATTHRKKMNLNDAASLALLLYRSNKQAIRKTIEQGEHGKFLASINFAGDVEMATDIDALPVLPILKEGRLVTDQDNPA